MIGTTELILLSGLALLLFGGKKLPEMMHGLGEGVKEFKKGMKETSDTEKKEIDTPPDDKSNKYKEQIEESENSSTHNDKSKR